MKQMSLSPINLLGAKTIGAAVSGTAFDLGQSINVGFRNMKGFAQSASGEGVSLAVHFQQHDTSTASAAGWDLISGGQFTLTSAIGLSQCHFVPTKQYIRTVVVPTGGSAAVSVAALAEYGIV